MPSLFQEFNIVEKPSVPDYEPKLAYTLPDNGPDIVPVDMGVLLCQKINISSEPAKAGLTFDMGRNGGIC